MCISTAPSHMSATKIYVGQATRPDGTLVHVLGYANSANTPGTNAMVLPIPAVTPPKKEDFFDMRGERAEFFNRYIKKHLPDLRSRSLTKGVAPSLSSRGFEVFNVGSYTVLVAKDASNIRDAVNTLPFGDRPMMSDAILAEMGRLYPGWPILVCVWAGNIKAEPIMLSYVPRDPSTLFIPMKDSHDGKTFPTYADRDHTICVGNPGESDPTAPAGMSWVFSEDARSRVVTGGSMNKDLEFKGGNLSFI